MATSTPQPTTQTSSLPYPHSPDRTLHISLTILATSHLIFLTSTSSASASSFLEPQLDNANANAQNLESDEPVPSEATAAAASAGGAGDIRGLSALGSFVYGLPNRFSLTEPLTTPLVSVPNTVELATRICRILVIRLAKLAEPKAVYVGCSIMVDGFGDRVREEVDVLECVVGEVGRLVGRQQVR